MTVISPSNNEFICGFGGDDDDDDLANRKWPVKCLISFTIFTVLPS